MKKNRGKLPVFGFGGQPCDLPTMQQSLLRGPIIVRTTKNLPFMTKGNLIVKRKLSLSVDGKICGYRQADLVGHFGDIVSALLSF